MTNFNYLGSRHILIVPCEAFAQPQVTPPRRRDEISKPHVSALVNYDRCDILLRPRRGLVGVIEHSRLPIRYQAPILHCPSCEIWNGHHVHLLKVVVLVEEVGQDLEAPGSDLEGVLGLIDGVRTSPYGEVVFLIHERRKIRYDERNEIGGHQHARCKGVPNAPVSEKQFRNNKRISTRFYALPGGSQFVKKQSDVEGKLFPKLS